MANESEVVLCHEFSVWINGRVNLPRWIFIGVAAVIIKIPWYNKGQLNSFFIYLFIYFFKHFTWSTRLDDPETWLIRVKINELLMKRQISGENEVSSNWKTTYRKSRFFVQLYFVLRSINVEKRKKYTLDSN